MKADVRKLASALKIGKRSIALLDQYESELSAPPTKSKYRQPDGRRRVAVPQVQQALDDWFTDVRRTLKARLSKFTFKVQATLLYD